MITHKEARIEAVSYNHEAIRVILKYIEQQEKKDELLRMYKKYSKGLISGKLCVQQLFDINLKIKALEEELK